MVNKFKSEKNKIGCKQIRLLTCSKLLEIAINTTLQRLIKTQSLAIHLQVKQTSKINKKTIANKVKIKKHPIYCT